MKSHSEFISESQKFKYDTKRDAEMNSALTIFKFLHSLFKVNVVNSSSVIP